MDAAEAFQLVGGESAHRGEACQTVGGLPRASWRQRIEEREPATANTRRFLPRDHPSRHQGIEVVPQGGVGEAHLVQEVMDGLGPLAS